MTYVAAANRYSSMRYRRSGRSGVLLPELSLGLWQNFGEERPLEASKAICRRAFDLGITHFDLANNYGPPFGSAETNFGAHLRRDFRPYQAPEPAGIVRIRQSSGVDQGPVLNRDSSPSAVDQANRHFGRS